ncbi:MFS transporter [Alkalibacillus aidingensis]|uniref:MFS transporter n=1 Tax=Alkalibacillus aidingensis TaxID=2747607 RepID=UPI00166084F4|nr:MFS transporter [Alkalibacillus aidingensis]
MLYRENFTPWKMLIVLFILQAFVALIGRSISPLGVVIGEDLSLTKTQIGMLPAAFFVGQSLNSIPSGLMTDRIGSKKMIIVIVLLTGLSFLFATLSLYYSLLLLFLFLGGAGYGAMHPAANRGVLYWFPKEKLGTAMGIKQTGVTIGSALSALILLPLANEFGWRTVVGIASMCLIIYGSIAYKMYFEPKSVSANQKKVTIEEYIKRLLAVVKHRTLLLISISAMGLSAGQMILNTYIVLFAFEHLGYTIFLSGLLLVISEVSGSSGRILWGMISDRLFAGKRIIVMIIITIFAGSQAFILSVLPEGFPFLLVGMIVVILGFCISGFNGIWMNAATEVVPKEQSGASSGFSIMVGTMGVLVGPPIFGMVVDLTGGYSFGWIYFTILMMFVFIILSVTRKIN